MTRKKDEHEEQIEHGYGDEREKLPVAEQGQPADRKPVERDDAEMERMRREDPLFIEKTRPEDPSGRPGQLTRDNVNPSIPSGKPGDPPGPIVDPNTLGMPQGGIAPTGLMQPERSPDQAPRLPDQDHSKDKGK